MKHTASEIRQSAILADHGILIAADLSPPASPPETPPDSGTRMPPTIVGNAERMRSRTRNASQPASQARSPRKCERLPLALYETNSLRQSAILADHGIIIPSPPASPPETEIRIRPAVARAAREGRTLDDFLARLGAAELRDNERLSMSERSAR